MSKKAKLIITDTYYNVFPTLVKSLEGKTDNLTQSNLVFCEEKISLMAERYICSNLGGSFNTDVYSFGNYLRAKKPIENQLSKEGSAMVVKRVIADLSLDCFKKSKKNLAPTLFDLIIQLKSAKVTPDAIESALIDTDGVLKNKLSDISKIYKAYEDYVNEHNLIDQSKQLEFLPDVIDCDERIKNSDVYLIGYGSFTKQVENAIERLLINAKSVTAILTASKKNRVYVNETADEYLRLAKNLNVEVDIESVKTDATKEADLLLQSLYNPREKVENKIKTDKIRLLKAQTVREEVERVAETIKAGVLREGYRYRDFTIAIPDGNSYKNDISEVFSELEIPYFLDEKKHPENHPVITLILSYVNVFAKNFERNEVLSFAKNPFVSDDKDFNDRFEKYILKYNLNYNRLKEKFVLPATTEEELVEFEGFRQKIVELTHRFDVYSLLTNLSVQEKLDKMAQVLSDMGEIEEGQISTQMYEYVLNILNNISTLLGGVNMSYYEWKSVFLSGVSAIELSLIPQRQDAVFIGGYKEVALARARCLFCVGLNESVPVLKEDVSLLNDTDIKNLENLQVLINPKISAVNERTRENVCMAVTSFNERLFLSCPIVDDRGKKNVKSDIIKYAESVFEIAPYGYEYGYLTQKQGLKTFAKSCAEYAYKNATEIPDATSYYYICDNSLTKPILDSANKTLKVRLECENKNLIPLGPSPTLIEAYYSCPFKAFASKILKLKEKDIGSVDALSVGNLVHLILENYVKQMGEVKTREESDALVDNVINSVVLTKEQYSRYLTDECETATFKRIKKEAKEYCYKTLSYFNNSDFVPSKFESKIEVPLLNGRVVLHGKVDRIDTFGDYYRIIDYKTGSVKSEDKYLFSGTKLQLFLYPNAIKDKTLAGTYYMPIGGDYKSELASEMVVGKTLRNLDSIYAQDRGIQNGSPNGFLSKHTGTQNQWDSSLDASVLNAYVDYAIKMSEQATEQMENGVIVSSPFDGECEYCHFKGLCQIEDSEERKLNKVDKSAIIKATVMPKETEEKEGQDGQK